MHRDKNPDTTKRFVALLDEFDSNETPLVGLTNQDSKAVLIAQLVDSVRRLEYLRVKSMRAKSENLHTPYSGSFDPFGGAAKLYKTGRIDDAYWLVYLATHCGKHKFDGWNLTEDIYGKFEQGGIWDWQASKNNPDAITEWFNEIYPEVTSAGRSRRFGNHRKYETLKPGRKGTGHALKSYILWINEYGSHQEMIASAQKDVGQNPQNVFKFMYKELDKVSKMGRLGKFDFLCNLSNLQISPILPDKAYISDATGPLSGAKMLFGGGLNKPELETACAALATQLSVSPQVIEDALCNWQKSTQEYIYFRG